MRELEDQINKLIPLLDPVDDYFLIGLLKYKAHDGKQDYLQKTSFNDTERTNAKNGVKGLLRNYWDTEHVGKRLRKLRHLYYHETNCEKCRFSVEWNSYKDRYMQIADETDRCDRCVKWNFKLGEELDNEEAFRESVVLNVVDNNPDFIDLKTMLNKVKRRISEIKRKENGKILIKDLENDTD